MQKSKSKLNKLSRFLAFELSCFRALSLSRSLAFSLSSFFKRERGYTLIELLIVVIIVVLLIGLSLSGYQARKKYDILITETQKIAQMLRRAQNLALSPQYGSDVVEGFGINLATSTSGGIVTLFKDIGSGQDGKYTTPPDIKMEELQLNSQIKIASFTPSGSSLDIVYIPPDPLVSININNGVTTNAQIRIELVSDANIYKIINVATIGLVEVQ